VGVKGKGDGVAGKKNDGNSSSHAKIADVARKGERISSTQGLREVSMPRVNFWSKKMIGMKATSSVRWESGK